MKTAGMQWSGELLLERARLERWAREQALPLWRSVGFNDVTNRFHERLDLTGCPIIDVPLRLMVQARQVFVYSTAHLIGWAPEADVLVESVLRSMVASFFEVDGESGWIYSVSKSGAIADSTRDTYAHAFALFAIASAYRVEPHKAWIDVANTTLSFLDAKLSASGGGYIDGLPRGDGLRRQNPHMHLLEALLALYEATGDDSYLTRAFALFRLFQEIFFDDATRSLAEYFDDDWRQAPGVQGRIREPGHHYEWAWLLLRLSAYDASAKTYAIALIEYADRHGWDQDGFIVDQVLDTGEIYLPSRRVWPLTEAIKAYTRLSNLTGANNSKMLTHSVRILLQHYLSTPFPGGWADQLSPEGAIMTSFVPASALYHIVGAISELCQTPCEKNLAAG